MTDMESTSAVNLPGVTLVAATSVALEATVAALRRSMSQVRFAKVILLTDQPGCDSREGEIILRRIDAIRSKVDYSRFILHELWRHVETGHALCVQWDGYVLDGRAWDPRFLDYDYIGSVWPHFSDGHNVGNGGFSLRSRKLLLATSHLPYDGQSAEDVLIGRTYRRKLEREGIRFAPEALARRFAYERTAPTGGEFGFHGAFNLVKLRSRDELLILLRSLEPQVLSHHEHKELLRWAVFSGYLKIALLLARRMFRKIRPPI